MKRFLTAVPEGTAYNVESCIDPSPRLRTRGLASPYYGAFGGRPPRPAEDCEILFLFLVDPVSALATIEGSWVRAERSCVFITHGHASVGVITPDLSLIEKSKGLLGEHGGFEQWSVRHGVLEPHGVQVAEPSPSRQIEVALEVPDELSYEAATQLRQLASNLSALAPIAERYFPEFAPTLDAFVDHAATSVEQLLALDDATSLRAVQERHQVVSGLVELNAGISMLYAQAGGGSVPLLRPSSAVAEYSLLGIGHAWRGLFGLYRNLHKVFTEAALLDALDGVFRGGHSVRSLVLRDAPNFDDWYQSSARLSEQNYGRAAAPQWRGHAVYFSGRQGFHETYGTMSAAWQAVHASASREWSLLTLSHEFVHAHVRDLVAWIFDRADFDQLVSNWTCTEKLPVKEAMQLAILSSLRYVAIVRGQLDGIDTSSDIIDIADWEAVPTASELERLAQGRSRRYAHEIFVHVLDFLYIYGGNEDRYVKAIWGSWSHVPSVSRRLHHYVLRTLCALSGSRDRLTEQATTFLSVEHKLAGILSALNVELGGRNAVVIAALDYMRSESGKRRLQIEYSHAFPLVAFARYFLYDGRAITARLAHDPDEVVTDEGRYIDVAVGTYHTSMRPTAFLLDQHASYPSVVDRHSEYRSLWQLFQLGG